jgi:hypothetical protein
LNFNIPVCVEIFQPKGIGLLLHDFQRYFPCTDGNDMLQIFEVSAVFELQAFGMANEHSIHVTNDQHPRIPFMHGHFPKLPIWTELSETVKIFQKSLVFKGYRYLF